MPRRIPAMPGTPDSTLPGLSSQHHHACPFAPVIFCRSSPAGQPASRPIPPDPGSGVRAGICVRDLKFWIHPAFPVLF